LFARLPNLELVLLVGQYAQAWHLGRAVGGGGLTTTVGRWRDVYRSTDYPRLMPMPHPSWRNNAWLIRNPWFELELLPALQADVARIVAPAHTMELSHGPSEPAPGQKRSATHGNKPLRRSATGLL
jgi:Uracil DNA glycosylase superfamily